MAENEQKPESGGISSWGGSLLGAVFDVVQNGLMSFGWGQFTKAVGLGQTPMHKKYPSLGEHIGVSAGLYGVDAAARIAGQELQNQAGNGSLLADVLGHGLGAAHNWWGNEVATDLFGLKPSPMHSWTGGNPAIEIPANAAGGMLLDTLRKGLEQERTPNPQEYPQPAAPTEYHQIQPVQQYELRGQPQLEQPVAPPPKIIPDARPSYEPPPVTAQMQETGRNRSGFDGVGKHAGAAFDELDSLTTNNGRRYPDMPDNEKPGRPDTKGIQKRAESAWDELDREVGNAPWNRPQERRAAAPPVTKPESKVPAAPPGGFKDGVPYVVGPDNQFHPVQPREQNPSTPTINVDGRQGPQMSKVQGFYQILGVGGVTQDSSGKTVPATEGNIEQHFKKPLPPAPPKNTIDLDGDGIPDVPLRPTYNMPMEHKGSRSMLHDDGMIMQAPDPAKSDQFKKCVEYAEKHGLTAVLALPRQDVDLNGRETPGRSTLAQNHPTTIYLDKNGNEVRPPDAPKYREFPGIEQNGFKEQPKAAPPKQGGSDQRPPQMGDKPVMKEVSPGVDLLAPRRQAIKDEMEKRGLFSTDPEERRLQEQRIDTGGAAYIRQREGVLGIEQKNPKPFNPDGIKEHSNGAFDFMDKKIAEQEKPQGQYDTGGFKPASYDPSLLTPARSTTAMFNSFAEPSIKCEVDCKAAFTAAAKGIEPTTPSLELGSSLENTKLTTASATVTTGLPKLG